MLGFVFTTVGQFPARTPEGSLARFPYVPHVLLFKLCLILPPFPRVHTHVPNVSTITFPIPAVFCLLVLPPNFVCFVFVILFLVAQFSLIFTSFCYFINKSPVFSSDPCIWVCILYLWRHPLLIGTHSWYQHLSTLILVIIVILQCVLYMCICACPCLCHLTHTPLPYTLYPCIVLLCTVFGFADPTAPFARGHVTNKSSNICPTIVSLTLLPLLLTLNLHRASHSTFGYLLELYLSEIPPDTLRTHLAKKMALSKT